MKVSALEEYGIRCMVLLARTRGGPMTLPEISEREGLSLAYAGKLLMLLKNAKLVKSVRGCRGGYVLAKPAEAFKLKQIFDALGTPLYNPRHCNRYTGKLEDCVHTADCTIRALWRGFSKIFDNVLTGLTLADLANGSYDFKRIHQGILTY